MDYRPWTMNFPPNRKNPKIFSSIQMSLRNCAGLIAYLLNSLHWTDNCVGLSFTRDKNQRNPLISFNV